MLRKILIVLFLSWLVCSCDTNDPYQGQYVDVSFEEIRTFGQPDSLSESTIHFSREARLGPNGNIYVADAGAPEIKVYAPSGKFLNSFGKRGRGPREFTGIRGFAVTDSTALVWDQGMQRMTSFGLNGELIGVRDFKGVTSAMRIYPMQNSYLLLHGENRNPSKFRETRLGHTYPSGSSKPQNSFLALKEVDESIEDVSRILLGGFGSVYIQKNEKFLFVPYIYNGNLYEYSQTSDGWQQTRVVEGLNQEKPYTIVENDGERKADAGISAVDLAKKKEFIVHNLTRGLFKYEGHIFHFIFTDINKKRVFGVEVYDSNLNHIGFSPIKSIPITNKEDNFIDWTVEAVDEKGNFYFLKETDTGQKMSVMQVNSNDLKRLSD